MAHSMSTEPAKIYPYHLLLITNYRLPADVDRLNLEVRHGICGGMDFYNYPAHIHFYPWLYSEGGIMFSTPVLLLNGIKTFSFLKVWLRIILWWK
jgi:hypothetical protein